MENDNCSENISIDTLQSLILCMSVTEKILLAKIEKIVAENNKVYENKNVLKKIVNDGLSSLHYDSSICKSKWNKPSFYPGEYEFIDVIVEGERLIIDIDFRSEFEIAKPTETYKMILESLPFIFVGNPKRLTEMILVISEAVKKSLRKKRMHVPPWRKTDYMLSKWLSPLCVRAKQPLSSYSVLIPNVLIPAWQPPIVKQNCLQTKRKLLNGLASLFNHKQ
ncbi:hypothetical protein Lal_00032576 [Lupinus albus]|uniref:Uncharacterized protein n=1 Tax=Lupinus albus TaxID=3870 RepID=A0A6A5PJ48_LUPAL|nr:hypothetical protein Lalb_Chr01g0020851 [Lupinus albus]KAF1897816.1 hypothetical protein Lal_00032576 [Lupinus albus]